MAKKILIIEDDPLLQKTLVGMLEDEGFEVKGCSKASLAFSYMNDNKPDLIMTDLVMHETDGFEILRTINESPELSTIKTIVLSNLFEKEHVDRAKELGADDFIIKADTSLKEIVDKIKKLLK